MPPTIRASSTRAVLCAWWATFFLVAFVCASPALLPQKANAASALLKPPNNLGLVGYWSFNEGTGTIATDFSGNGNTGTLSTAGSGIPTWTNGKRGKALAFDDDTESYVNVASSPGLNPTSAITVSAWIRANTWAGGNHRIIEKGNDNQYGLLDNNDVLSWYIFGVNELDVALPSAGVWHHIVGTYDGTNSVYIDGALVDSSVAGGAIPTTAEDLNIGTKPSAGATGDYFDGIIDEVRIYNRALGPTEVAKLYQSGAVKFTTSSAALDDGSSLEQGLVGHWTFDGPDVTTVVADRSGQDNNGYFVGGATSSAKTIGKLGQALRFDGDQDYVSVQSSTSLNLTTAITISAWVRADTWTGNPRIVEKGDSSNQYSLRNDSGVLTWEIFGISFLQTTLPSIGVWHHIVATYNGSADALYIDEVLLNSSTPSGSIPTTANPLYIGTKNSCAFDTDCFDGIIDDVRIYNRALTAAEVKQLYQLGGVKIKQ